MRIPMREKYVDEAVGIWIVFGYHPDGTVDVADQRSDVFQRLDRDIAEKIVKAQAKFRLELYDILCEK